MDKLYDQTLLNMERTVHMLAQRVPQPVRVPYKDGFVYRHIEKSIHQALVQKSARIVSTLQAARLLMNHGFVQEQASLQRILDEMDEDVMFLAYTVIFNDKTLLQQAYLDSFFEEEFDAASAVASTQKRPMVPRKKIRAYIARMEGTPMDSSRGVELARTLSKAYSGYIHAASPQIMDMYGGSPARFHVRGMRGTSRHLEHQADLWNYFYRSIIAFSFIAKAFGDEELFATIHEFTREFERLSGKNYESKEWGEI
ncbi:hypothetical protein [Thiovibrio frasassiensis]|uniref:Uncharacterized protein n=1 Tax=Thiovibrio frasassiensis TaxID=2984131 RepID=A0A9X4MFB8_9BACT|nr:hypothetical protein [Thiovibrio frasassiensis]MDG4475140.1 hypothetical protein [Thiovibrio frasassiensis]